VSAPTLSVALLVWKKRIRSKTERTNAELFRLLSLEIYKNHDTNYNTSILINCLCFNSTIMASLKVFSLIVFLLTDLFSSRPWSPSRRADETTKSKTVVRVCILFTIDNNDIFIPDLQQHYFIIMFIFLAMLQINTRIRN